MQKLVEFAPAKVNLYLKVIGKRPDGYHNIETLFEKINIIDKITLKLKKSGISIKSKDKSIPLDEDNICYKAAELMRDKFGVSSGVEISIVKNIPVAAGLGGGSSDAAAAIRGLNKLWGLKLGPKELLNIGAMIGSDVAFFITEAPYALGYGRGELVKPLKIRHNLWHLVITPPIRLLSGDIYRLFAGIRRNLIRRYPRSVGKRSFALTRSDGIDTIQPPKLDIGNMGQLNTLLHNDLEDIVVLREPIIKGIKTALLLNGALGAIVSGSGSSVFGLFRSEKEARRAQKKYFNGLPSRKGWRAFIAGTYLITPKKGA